MVGLGALEARSSSFVPGSRAYGRPARPLKPLSEAESYLRTDLVPVLLGRLEHNWSRGRRDVRLFEIGTVFQSAPRAGKKGERPEGSIPFVEEMRVALVATGLRAPAHWSTADADVDIWDLKGWMEFLIDDLGLGRILPCQDVPEGERLPIASEWLSTESLCIFQEDGLVGIAGRVREDAVDAPVWGAPVYALEFRLAAVRLESGRQYEELPTFPAVARDLAIVLSRDVPAEDVAEAIRSLGPGTLESTTLFDVYEGDKVGAGKRSLAWRLVFRAADRTLRDEEVEESVKSITVNLEERFDARIRSS
jgi:phenylalanyl-tRNA synthetase beta chain